MNFFEDVLILYNKVCFNDKVLSVWIHEKAMRIFNSLYYWLQLEPSVIV